MKVMATNMKLIPTLMMSVVSMGKGKIFDQLSVYG